MEVEANRVEALRLSKELKATASNIERVGRATSAAASSWAFTQWDLRKRARAKFRLAEEMLFVREALEQASHENLAAFHASLFPQGVLVADLTAGIGADLIALARRGPAVGFELDAERAQFARHNLSVHGLDAEIRVADSLGANWDFEYAFVDPSRRVSGSRTLDPTAFSPDPFQLAERMVYLKLGVMKLTPMLPDTVLNRVAPYQGFLSLGRECREALLITGSEAPTGREAILLETGVRLKSGGPLPKTNTPEAYLFEADPAAIRADALGTLAEELHLKAVGDSNGYLTGASIVDNPWLRNYKVIGFHKVDVAKTKKLLRELGSGTPVVKTRGGVDAAKLQKELKLEGAAEFVVAVYPIGKVLWHVVLKCL